MRQSRQRQPPEHGPDPLEPDTGRSGPGHRHLHPRVRHRSRPPGSGARYSRTTRTPSGEPSPPSPPAWRTPRWAGAGLATFAIVGTKTVRLVAGRIFRPGSTRPRRDWTLPARCRMGGKTVHPSGATGERLTRADSGGPLTRTGETTTTPRTRWSGGASQPIVPAIVHSHRGDVAPVLGAIMHRLRYAGKTLAQSQKYV